jgi:hypothetical protein
MNHAAEGETAPNQRDQHNREKLPVHVLGIAPLREIGKRGLLVGRASSRAGTWSARTCPRFEGGDVSPHSKKWLVGSLASPSAGLVKFFTAAQIAPRVLARRFF